MFSNVLQKGPIEVIQLQHSGFKSSMASHFSLIAFLAAEAAQRLGKSQRDKGTDKETNSRLVFFKLCLGQDRSKLVRTVQNFSKLGRTGQDRSGHIGTGYDRSGQDKKGQDESE